MNTHVFPETGKIVVGVYSLQQLAAHLPAVGPIRSALIVGQPSGVRQGFVDEIRSQLIAAGMDCDSFTKVVPEPISPMCSTYTKLRWGGGTSMC